MPLSDVGHYTFAASLVGVVAMLSGPIGNAFYPRLTQLIHQHDDDAVAATFHRLSGLMALIVGSAAAMLVCFGDRLMNAWIHNPELSARTSPLLALLALGAIFNTLTSLPYLLQLAHGVTRIALRNNFALLFVFIPGLVIAVSRFGGIGAAACWAALNIVAWALSAMLTFPRYMPGEGARWLIADLARPLIAVFAAALLLSRIVPTASSFPIEAAQLGACGLTVLLIGALTDSQIRNVLRAKLDPVFARSTS
jgi:O-antigen/teichoic acid export membrane protein